MYYKPEKGDTWYIPEGKESRQLNMIAEQMEYMKKVRAKKEAEWDEADKQYQMFLEERPKEEWRSQLKLPTTFAIVETALSEMIEQSPGISLRPREPGDKKAAKNLQAIWDYTWEKGDGDLELYYFAKDFLIYGNAVAEEYYRKENREVKSISEMDEETNQPKKWKKVERQEYDDCYFETINLKDFYVDEMAMNFSKARYCVKRQIVSYDTAKQWHGHYQNFKYVIEGKKSLEYVPWFKPTMELDNNQVELLHYYNKEQDLYHLRCQGILLTKPDNPIPYKHKDFPFVWGTDVPLPHSVWGIGEPKIVQGLQQERDTLRNMRIDTVHLNIQTQFLVDDRIELDDNDFISRPHGIYKGPPGSIVPIPSRPLYNEAYREDEALMQDIVRATGIDPQPPMRGDTTATEVAIVKETQLKRIRMKLRLMERMALRRAARLRIANIQQFYSIPKIESVIGENGKPIAEEQFRMIPKMTKKGKTIYFTTHPEDITGEVDIKVLPGSTQPVSRAMEEQKATIRYDRLVGHPEIDQRKLVEKYLEATGENPDEYTIEKGPEGGMGGMGGPAGGLPIGPRPTGGPPTALSNRFTVSQTGGPATPSIGQEVLPARNMGTVGGGL